MDFGFTQSRHPQSITFAAFKLIGGRYSGRHSAYLSDSVKMGSPVADIPCDLTWVRVIAIKVLVPVDEETEPLKFLFGRRFLLWDIKVSKRGQLRVPKSTPLPMPSYIAPLFRKPAIPSSAIWVTTH